MLKGIPKNISPELLKVLMEMGHGDEIVIAYGNYPAASNAKKLVRCDGLNIPELLESILTLFPLDVYVDSAISLMSTENVDPNPEIWEVYRKIFNEKSVENNNIMYMNREDFYERGKRAYAIVATGEEAIYANVILKKGVIK